LPPRKKKRKKTPNQKTGSGEGTGGGNVWKTNRQWCIGAAKNNATRPLGKKKR